MTCLAFFITLTRGNSVQEFELLICAVGPGFVAWMLITPFSLQILSTILRQLINRLTPEYIQAPWCILDYNLFYLKEIKIT